MRLSFRSSHLWGGLRLAMGQVAAAGLLLLAAGSSARAYELLLEHRWEQMPVPIWVNPIGAPDMGPGASPEEVVLDAIAQWEGVGTAAVSFEFMGTTTAGWGADGINVVVWVSDTWKWQEAAAGATWWFPPVEGKPREVDLELNAVKYQWVPGGGSALQSDVVDPVSVVTHELGHWLAMSHSSDPFATMYFALLPNGLQATLSADDKAGISTLYPSGVAADCQSDADCPVDLPTGAAGRCVQVNGLSVCGEAHDSTGDPCSETLINCDGMCWVDFADCKSLCIFTAFDYSAGYCAELCAQDSQCPSGYACKSIPKYSISACMPDGTGPQDPSPESAEFVESTDVVEQPDGVESVEVWSDLGSDHGVGPDAPGDLAQSSDQVDTNLLPDSTPLDCLPGQTDVAEPKKGSSGCSVPSSSQAHSHSSVPILLLMALLLLSNIRIRRRRA